MTDFSKYVGKTVIIADDDNKEWKGIVDSFNPDDELEDYTGETIDICVNGSPNDIVWRTKAQICSIKLA
ncbi:hypothetical protein [Ruminococcus sp.]|uniref:hypothetical protein n=1 Tax=Ruminococcus sp. TaxID=41978 RepID=UPI00386FB52C